MAVVKGRLRVSQTGALLTSIQFNLPHASGSLHMVTSQSLDRFWHIQVREDLPLNEPRLPFENLSTICPKPNDNSWP
jgi:hypothetical protein